MTHIVVLLEIEGDQTDAFRAVDHVLDEGILQNEIERYGDAEAAGDLGPPGGRPVKVRSAMSYPGDPFAEMVAKMQRFEARMAETCPKCSEQRRYHERWDFEHCWSVARKKREELEREEAER